MKRMKANTILASLRLAPKEGNVVAAHKINSKLLEIRFPSLQKKEKKRRRRSSGQKQRQTKHQHLPKTSVVKRLMSEVATRRPISASPAGEETVA